MIGAGANDLQLLSSGCRCGRYFFGDDELEAGVRLNLISGNTRVQRLEPQVFRVFGEIHDTQWRYAVLGSPAGNSQLSPSFGIAVTPAKCADVVAFVHEGASCV